MTVSNEDRDPLVHKLSMEDYMAAAVGLHGRTPGYYGNLAEAAKNWLVSHGWGPRPTVSRDAVIEHVARLRVDKAPVINGAVTILAESMADALVPFLRECGIEVTDD